MKQALILIPRPPLRKVAAMLALAASAWVAPAAHAGLFDDDEARRAILDIRQRIDQSSEQSRARSAELNDQLNVLRRSVLDLNTQIETMRGDMARMRGDNEQLTRSVSELQRLQKDIQQGVDDRIKKLEPQKVTLDGRDFMADVEETRAFDEALALLRKGDFAGSTSAFAAFRQRYPNSGYGENALFWQGNAQYGKRDYKEAINSFRQLVSAAPSNPHAPEALLSIANCQVELKDAKSARRTLDELVKTYPKSEAAQAGRERIASAK
ncbi:MAG: putative transrane protein [Rhizobacter sp.]|nr:putative transrane protein [Rhizobacter sp.]